MEILKLFVWEYVLTGYSDGIMFALATDVDSARELIKAKMIKEKRIGIKEAMIELVERDPRIIESEEGFFIEGGG